MHATKEDNGHNGGHLNLMTGDAYHLHPQRFSMHPPAGVGSSRHDAADGKQSSVGGAPMAPLRPHDAANLAGILVIRAAHSCCSDLRAKRPIWSSSSSPLLRECSERGA
eukprot:4052211-Pyramimonas_sp.AAC.1